MCEGRIYGGVGGVRRCSGKRGRRVRSSRDWGKGLGASVVGLDIGGAQHRGYIDSLEDLPLRTTNPPPPRPSFESIKRLANQPPPIPTMEPPLPPLPPHLPPLDPNNPFLMLTHEIFYEHCQRTQVIVDNLHDEM
ncbi:hypothetical protein Tco_0566338 [Tanacetum coccineum]